MRLWGELDALEREHRLDFLRRPDLGFAWVAYRWAEGDDLDDVLGASDLSAGDFVRWMKQLLDLAGQVADAAGDCRCGVPRGTVIDLRGAASSPTPASPSDRSEALRTRVRQMGPRPAVERDGARPARAAASGQTARQAADGVGDRGVAADEVPLLADRRGRRRGTAATTAATSARVTSPRSTSGAERRPGRWRGRR